MIFLTADDIAIIHLQILDTSVLEDKELEDFAVQVAVEHLDIPTIAAWLQSRSDEVE
jgi:hypothetical protein